MDKYIPTTYDACEVGACLRMVTTICMHNDEPTPCCYHHYGVWQTEQAFSNQGITLV